MSQFAKETYAAMIAELLPQATTQELEFVYHFLRAEPRLADQERGLSNE